MARALAAAGAGKALAATDKASAATNKSPPPAAVTDSAPAASEAPAPGPPMVFKLAWYHLNERLTVIQEFPAPRSGPDAASSELLQAILRALEDAALPQTLPQPEIFEWPLAQKADGGGLFGALAPMDDPRQAAREALGGFIRRRLERGPMQELLVFSEQLGPLLQDSPEAAPLSLTVTRGLDRVQAERALKREVWNALQPLKRRLQQSLQPGLQPGLQQSPDA